MKFFFFLLVFWLPVVLEAEGKGLRLNQGVEVDEKPAIKKDAWFGKDKAQHFVGSFFLAGSASYIFEYRGDCPRTKSTRLGVGFAISIGVLKECIDSRSPTGHFCWKDLVADLLGASLGGYLLGSW